MGCFGSTPGAAFRDQDQRRKIIVVGDGSVGKTCLIYRFISQEFWEASLTSPDEYIMTIAPELCNKVVNVQKGKKQISVNLIIYDTAGHEEFEALRKTAYPNSDLVLVCFRIDFKASLDNCRRMWIPELLQMCPNVPILLVGNKSDLRYAESNINCVSTEEAMRLVKDVPSCVGYLECSALNGNGVSNVFNRSAEEALKGSTGNRRSWN